MLSKICGIFEMVPSPNLCIDISAPFSTAEAIAHWVAVVVVVKH